MADVVQVSVADIERAAELIEGVAVRTPMEESRWLSALTGGPVLLKCENLQRTGSFKVRGAYVRMSRLSEEERARGVVAASRRQPRAGRRARRPAARHQGDGVHARGRADPQGEGHPGVRRGRASSTAATSRTRWSRPGSSRSETGAVLIHPFDHVDIVAGQGTSGWRSSSRPRTSRRSSCPCGGGGLLAGIAIAVKAKRPDVTGGRRPGRGRRGVPRLAGGGPPGRARAR